MATVYIPTLMRDITSQAEVQVAGSTVRQIIDNLEQAYPGLKDRLIENNRIRASISVVVDGEVTPIGLLEKVGEDSEVHFVPAIAGGNTLPLAVGPGSQRPAGDGQDRLPFFQVQDVDPALRPPVFTGQNTGKQQASGYPATIPGATVRTGRRRRTRSAGRMTG